MQFIYFIPIVTVCIEIIII